VTNLPSIHELSPSPDPLQAAAVLSGLPFLLFLDSATPQGPTSRYSFLSADPCYVIRSRGSITTRFMPVRGERVSIDADPLSCIHDLLAPFSGDLVPGLPPFQGGAAGYVGYEYGGRLERVPLPPFHDLNLPDVALGIYDWTIAWDHQSGKAWIISTGMPDVGDARERRAGERLRMVLSALSGPVPAVEPLEQKARTGMAPSFPVPGAAPEIRSTFTPHRYQASVRRIIEYILAGDVFQVNLSQRFEAPAPRDALALYRRLRRTNPAPFAAFLDYGEGIIASASPERFVRYDPAGRQVETRPIKGTRPRGETPNEDSELRRNLEESEKDRAENVMIVDLLRNDLSRVCRPGTIEVPALLALESHPTVHHLVSTVTGELEAGRDAFDLLRATFPGGSITGAPKIRAMEIIAELEPTERGPYCGCIGYWSLSGGMDTSIVIRTYVIAGDRVYFQAGGGIVADSDPEQEYQETLDKARALLEALDSL
jgi:para-aminobenzoate synthetase component 1